MRIYGSTDRMEVVLDTDAGTIWVTQRWKSSFLTFGRHQGRWTENEKITFQRRVCRIISGAWGDKAYLYIRPGVDNNFNRLYNGKTFTIKVKVQFVEHNENWNVKIYKARPEDKSDWDGWVDWAGREIHVTSNATTEFQHTPLIGSSEPGSNYRIIAHEFGHAMGYAGPFTDEYEPGNAMRFDTLSIMNLGSEVRQRHYGAVCKVLQTMCPGTNFGFRMH